MGKMNSMSFFSLIKAPSNACLHCIALTILFCCALNLHANTDELSLKCLNAIKSAASNGAIETCSKQKELARRGNNLSAQSWLDLYFIDIFMSQGKYNDHLDSLFKSTERSLEFSENKDFKYEWQRRMGSKYYHLENYSESKHHFQKALDLAENEKNIVWLAKSYNDVGLINKISGNYTEALRFFQSSLEYKERIGDLYSSAKTLNNLGLINKELADYPNAIVYYEKAYLYYQDYLKQKNPDLRANSGLFHLYRDLADIYALNNEFDKSLFYSNKVIENISKAKNKIAVIGSLTDLVNIAIEKSQYVEASEYAQQAYTLDKAEQLGHTPLYIALAIIETQKKNYKEATYFAENALIQAAEKNNPKQKTKSLTLLADIHKKSNSLENAIKYQDLLLLENEQYYQKKYDTDIKSIQANISKALVERELIQEKLLAEKEKSRFHLLRNWLLLALLLATLFIFALVINLSKKKVEKEKLQTEINYHKQQLQVLNNIEKQNKNITLSSPKNENLIDSHKTKRELLVETMQFCLACWEKSTGKNKVDFADESKIWKVSIDDGRLRTRSLDKYLVESKLPENPRLLNIIKTCHYVLSECDLSQQDRTKLNELLNSFN